MDSIFRSSWAHLTLEDIEAFLAEAGDESMTWEAKGTTRPHSGTVRKHVCGFANAIGGFFFVGVRRDEDRRWVADGVDFGDEEARTWLSRIIRSGFRDVPRYDIHVWSVSDRSQVAVVRVQPIASPPCMTADGQVYERVSGETVRVTDPLVISRLRERGEQREADTQAEAIRAANLTIPDREPPYLVFALAQSPLGKPDDIVARLFTEPYENVLGDVFERRLSPELLFPRVRHYRVHRSRDALTAAAEDEDNLRRWMVRVAWDASVAVSLDVRPKAEDAARLTADALFEVAIGPAADVAADLIKELGGYGRSYAVLRFWARRFSLSTQGELGGRQIPEPGQFAALPIATWTSDDGRLNEELLARMKRELLRSCGFRALEPVA